MREKVFLDTNFIIDLLKFKIGLEEIEDLLEKKVSFFILSSSINELKKLAENKGEVGKMAKIALKIVKLKNFSVMETEERPDKVFLTLMDKNTIIATNDSSLRRKLREKGMKTIYLRGRKKLEVG